MSTPQNLHTSGESAYAPSDSMSNSFLVNFSLADNTFDLTRSGGYHLSIQFSTRDLSFAILDLERNKYVFLENISLDGAAAPAKEIKNAFEHNSVLKSKFKSASALGVNNLATLVPNPIYDDSKAADFLELNLERIESLGITKESAIPEREICRDDLSELNSVNLYYLSSELVALLRKSQSDISIMHYSSVLIKSALLRYKNQHVKKLLVHFHKDAFDIIVIDQNQLKLYNTFSYQSKEDFVYYILFACEQLSINPELIETEVFGEIDKHSEYYSLLYTYIRNITIAKRPDNFEYSHQFEDLPEHYYFNLFSQYLCV